MAAFSTLIPSSVATAIPRIHSHQERQQLSPLEKVALYRPFLDLSGAAAFDNLPKRSYEDVTDTHLPT